jgi:hypothetical protein
MRTSHKLSGRVIAVSLVAVLVAAVVLAGCGGGDQEPVEVGQAGARPTAESVATTTTEEPLTTTTLAPAIVEIPEIPEWGQSWPGPVSTPGTIPMGEFNEFVRENAPDGATAEEAVTAYLQLDRNDPNVQMLVGERGGPEATAITVTYNITDDDSVRATRYHFVLERRQRAAEEEATEAGEEAEEGDLSGEEDESDSNEDDAATEEDLEVVEGPSGLPWVLSAELTVQCQPGRGHQDFTVELCV